mmetsp:Transcript_72509/g.167984  ORF Transcript_72509/g.167984 Transcript_72509/m.167984 type:complete len:113 (+) Transcript_72509:182-520(+)
MQYARAQCVFGDGMYHRVLLEVLYDPHRVRRQRLRGGVQIVLPSAGVSLKGVRFMPNQPAQKGEERLDSWDPNLEAVPPGQEDLAAVSLADRPASDVECLVGWHPAACHNGD